MSSVWVVRTFERGTDKAAGEMEFTREWIARTVAAAILRGDAVPVIDENGYTEILPPGAVDRVAVVEERDE